MTFSVLLISLFLTTSVERTDTVMLSGVDIVSSTKFSEEPGRKDYSATSLGRVELENRHINGIKELSSVVPNFYQPDYGSRMTSSIYVRGFGSRIDQPVVGLNIDQMPVMNKNNYDFELFDIDRVQIMRGAQSTLMGRNTAGGAINITTLSPLNFQGKRLTLEYGNENTVRVKASHYAAKSREFGWSASVYYNHNDGFYTNSYSGDKCDGGDNVATRLRFQWLPADRWSIDNTFSAGYVDEGGWGYRFYDAATGILAPVNYNEECYYKRFSLSDGLVVKRFFDSFTISSASGYQYTDDKMHIDNDFLPLDYFVLEQEQREHSFTQEFVIKSSDDKAFKWVAGLFGFYRHMFMEAPVNFREYGVSEIIEKYSGVCFKERDFTIYDNFTIPAWGAAGYAQVTYSLGDFDFSAGAHLNYEYSSMDYDSRSLVHYTTKSNSIFYAPLLTVFEGETEIDECELLPSFSVVYRHKYGNVYASARKGFKAGGFNTQLFSDILRNRMIAGLAHQAPAGDASATIYEPETNWNYEVGTHLSFFDGKLNVSASLFYIECRDQQLTVFPKGGTGRMMSNAGESHSLGAEFAATWRVGRFTIDGSYGYTKAEFDKYESDGENYAGNALPFAPHRTMAVNVACDLPVPRSFANRFVLNVGWNGTGRIYWNEANTLSQSFYGLLSASLLWEKGYFGASLWGKNLLDKEYNTFYFNSINHDFFANGKPLQFGASLHINL